MKKNILFIIISVLVVVVFLSTAALCNMCGLSLVSDEEQGNDNNGSSTSGKSGDSKSKSGSSSSESSSKDSQSGSDGKSSDDTKKDKNAPGKIEISDIVIGDIVGGKFKPVDFLLAGHSYNCVVLLEKPPNGTEEYQWSVSEGSFLGVLLDQPLGDCMPDLIYWTTPSKEGWYTIGLEITRLDGSFGNIKIDVKVNPSSILGPPLQMPTIVDIRVSRVSGFDDGGIYTEMEYNIIPMIDGSKELIDRIDFTWNGGDMLSVEGGIMKWKAPSDPQEVTITVYISDATGFEMDSKKIVLQVVHGV